LVHAPLWLALERRSGAIAIQIAASQIPMQLSAHKGVLNFARRVSRTVVISDDGGEVQMRFTRRQQLEFGARVAWWEIRRALSHATTP
jgi:hypothetical protein